MTTTTRTDAPSRDGSNSVAIVGAGFAGLVVANYLHKLENFEYTLLESKPSCGIPVIGTIRLESCREILEELGLFNDACSVSVFPNHRNNSDETEDSRYQTVSREDFLKLLRKRVLLQSSSRVVDILPNERNTSQNASYTIVAEEPTSGERSYCGPFGCVILAHGLVVRSATLSAASCRRVVRIGDCRPKAWWDWDVLGVRRRTQGANLAILDARRVVRELLCSSTEGPVDVEQRVFVFFGLPILGWMVGLLSILLAGRAVFS